MTPALSSLAQALASTIGEHRTRRVPLQQLRAAQARHDPTGAASAGARDTLASALLELADAAIVTFPRSASSFERHLHPPLPMWVERPPTPRPATQIRPARVWRPELAAAAAIAATPAELDVLTAVDQFLATSGHGPPVPHRERSLQLFGDEKALDRLARTRLFTSGALTLDLLRAYIAPLPLTATHTGDPGPEPVLLLVENHATYASALTLARQRAAAGEPALAVGYGSGNQVANAIGGITQMDPVPSRVAYFGDLDVGGLQIATGLTAHAAAHDLPPVEPATHLYRALVTHGVRAPARGGPIPAERAQTLAGWLRDPDLRTAAVDLLTSGQRMAQEAVGYEVLAALPTWA